MASYSSKRDWWLMAILWICFGLMVVGFVSALTEPVAPWMRAFAAGFFALFGAFMAWLLMLPRRTVYTLDSVFLTIRVGPFAHRISLSDITEAYPTHNPLSAPAWSLDRIRIRHSGSRFGALISPERQEQFLDELQTLAPQLEPRGRRLVATDGE